MTEIPSCPFCGHHDRATPVTHPDGKYFCSCGSLFNGTDEEWLRMARHRREAAERRGKSAHRVIEDTQ